MYYESSASEDLNESESSLREYLNESESSLPDTSGSESSLRENLSESESSASGDLSESESSLPSTNRYESSDSELSLLDANDYSFQSEELKRDNKRKYMDEKGIKYSKKNSYLEKYINNLMKSNEYKNFNSNPSNKYLANDVEELQELQEFKDFNSNHSKKLKSFDPINKNKLIKTEIDNDFNEDFQKIEIRRLFGEIPNNVDLKTLRNLCKQHNIKIPSSYTITQIFKVMFDFALEYNFDKDDTNYPTEYSKIKKYLNKLITIYIEKSNIKKEDQKALILENIQLNTINALISYNPLMKIIVTELNRNTIEKIAEIYYNRYEKYKDNVEFYSNTLIDTLVSDKCNDLPNIIFADFMGTYTGYQNSYKCNKKNCDFIIDKQFKDELDSHRHKKQNHEKIIYRNKDTIEKILKCNQNDEIILGLTFSRQGEHWGINTICKTDNFSVFSLMKCITNDLIKTFSKYNMKVSTMNLYQYYRTSIMTFYLFRLKRTDSSYFTEKYFKDISNYIKIRTIKEKNNKLTLQVLK